MSNIGLEGKQTRTPGENQLPKYIDVNIVIWPELYLLLNRPKSQLKQYPAVVTESVDENDTFKYPSKPMF